MTTPALIDLSELLSLLEQAAAQFSLRLAYSDGAAVVREPHSPLLEMELRDQVDRAGRELAVDLDRRLRRTTDDDGFPKIDPTVAELLVCRIRDAQRCLRETPPAAQSVSICDAKALIAGLLVDHWHSYAERYWLERMERFTLREPPSDG